MRLCRCHFSIAYARKNPPMNKKMVCSMYCAAVLSALMMPINGKNIIGINEVTARSMASLIHQPAIHINKKLMRAAGEGSPEFSIHCMMINPAIGKNKSLNNFIGVKGNDGMMPWRDVFMFVWDAQIKYLKTETRLMMWAMKRWKVIMILKNSSN